MPESKRAMGDVHKWLTGLALTVIAAAIAYQWLDRPIAFMAHDALRQFYIFDRLTQIPEWFAPLSIAVFIVLGLRGLTRRPLSRWEAVILLCSLSLVAAAEIKNRLKHIFGRTWPETWINNNPSLVHDGAYGFNFFHGGRGYESFPSGHTTAVCAVMSVLWICYPRFRPAYTAVVAAVAIGLIGANYHFLSDIIAGGFLGGSVGWIAIALWEAGCKSPLRPVQPTPEA